MLQQLLDRFLLRAVFNAFVAVDSFFVLGGCLLAYATFAQVWGTKIIVLFIALLTCVFHSVAA